MYKFSTCWIEKDGRIMYIDWILNRGAQVYDGLIMIIIQTAGSVNINMGKIPSQRIKRTDIHHIGPELVKPS